MTDEEYNCWFTEGYDANCRGEEAPHDTATAEQRRAWRDGYNSAEEERGQ